MSGRFEGQQAIVTGAGSGIGEAIAAALLDEGATVIGVRRSDRASRMLAGRERYRQVVADVSDEAAVERLVAACAATGPIAHVFNAAGIGSTTVAADTPLEVWDRVMDVNARGTFLMCKHAIPVMAAHGGGSVVNIGSIAALVGLPRRAAYAASKGAVVALTRALAIDHVREGVRVNCVCPGTIDTPWIDRLVDDAGESLEELRARQPMGRFGTAGEVATAALYLAGADAAFTTGTVLTVDGGMTAA